MPLLRIYSCSRELLLGTQDLLGWKLPIPDQPPGRAISGTTLIFELHRDGDDGELFVRSLFWVPGMDDAQQIEDVTIADLRARMQERFDAVGGTWDKICDFEHFNSWHNHHEGSDFVHPDLVHSSENVVAAAGLGVAQLVPISAAVALAGLAVVRRETLMARLRGYARLG